MKILISDSSTGKLFTKVSQPYLIINLMDNFFLLTKAVQGISVQKNINFQILQKQYYSTFERHVNLPYSTKLSGLIQSLSIKTNPSLQHQWLMLYQIHGFPISTQTSLYKLGIPSYGQEVMIHSQNQQMKSTRVSNMFRFDSETFYFLSCSPTCCSELAIITDITQTIIYGITYLVKDVTICLPFHSISSEKPCPMSIFPSIKPLLQLTCYVIHNGNYCTGLVLRQDFIISARHVLHIQQQRLGLQVGIRFFPFTQQKIGCVTQIGQGSVDIIVIQIHTKKQTKNQAVSFQRSNLFETKINQQQLVGKQILALGFGRYNFSSRIFHKIDLIFPTIENGTISKVISLGNSIVFIKTDANLYNGFSGCGVWYEMSLIGMAVFILKNKNNQSNFNRHNFSYSLRFIMDLIKKDHKQYLISEINAQLNYFDRVQTRHQITLSPKL